jgi:hypothetical protein
MSANGSAGSGLAKPELFKWYKISGMVASLLVAIQAVLAGQFFKGKMNLIERHGEIGNLTFLAVVAFGVLAYLMGVPPAKRSTLLIMHTVLIVLVIAQIGLGYSATNADDPSANAAAWHIPNGVLIFGVLMFLHARMNLYAPKNE